MTMPDDPAGRGAYNPHVQPGAQQHYYQQPGPPPAPAPAPAPAAAFPVAAVSAKGKGFLKSLFDLSFSSFITSRLVKVIYVLLIILSIGSGIAMALSGAVTAVGGLSEKKEPDLASLYGGDSPFGARRGNPFARGLAEPPAKAEPETQVNPLKVAGGLGMLLLSPFVTLLSIIISRVYMELVIVLFRIAENIGEINHKTRAS